MSDLHSIVERVRALPKPALIGIGGAVAVGKSTIAAALAHELGATVLSTDAFLFPNAVLNDRRLLMQKGFPETYDPNAMRAVLRDLRDGRTAVVPVYSHGTYDVVPGELDEVPPTDILLLEGVVALQDYVRGKLDLALYIDAPPEAVRTWFIDRFVRWTAEARTSPESFYKMFVDLDDAALRTVAEATWDGINGVNLEQHIARTRGNADLVITKGPDHAILSIAPPT